MYSEWVRFSVRGGDLQSNQILSKCYYCFVWTKINSVVRKFNRSTNHKLVFDLNLNEYETFTKIFENPFLNV